MMKRDYTFPDGSKAHMDLTVDWGEKRWEYWTVSPIFSAEYIVLKFTLDQVLPSSSNV